MAAAGPGNAWLVGDMDGDGRADAVVGRRVAPRGIWVGRSTINQYGGHHFITSSGSGRGSVRCG